VHPDEHLDSLKRDGEIVAALAGGDLSAAVPACPGWTLETLVNHLGRVHRWATSVVRRGAADDRPPFPPALQAVDQAWFTDGLDGLVAALTEAGPDAPAWTFPGVATSTVRFWYRRQAQETSMHRWDAQSAAAGVGGAEPIEVELAVDGVDELLDQFAGPMRQLREQEPAELGGAVHLCATDSPHGEWTVRTDGRELLVGHGHVHDGEQADAIVRATASDLLLWLWGRAPADRLEVTGDAAMVARWHEVLPAP
jgi:uncharacterized protein (TIGR03083 family)